MVSTPQRILLDLYRDCIFIAETYYVTCIPYEYSLLTGSNDCVSVSTLYCITVMPICKTYSTHEGWLMEERPNAILHGKGLNGFRLQAWYALGLHRRVQPLGYNCTRS